MTVYITLFFILHVDILGMEDFTSSQSWSVILVYKPIGKTNIQLSLKTHILIHVCTCKYMFMYKIRSQILWNNELKTDFLLLRKSLVIGSKEIFLTIKYIFCVWNSLLDCCIQRYDPYSKVFSKEYYDTEKMHSIRRNAIEKASQGKKYGVVLGTLGRQGSTKVLQVPVIYVYWLPISLN